MRSVPRGATCWLRIGAVRTCALLWTVCHACVRRQLRQTDTYSSYNIHSNKKLSEHEILKHWNKSRDVHPCDLVPRCQVSRCPPLLHGLTFSSLAMSVPTILMVSRCQVSRFQSPPRHVLFSTINELNYDVNYTLYIYLPGGLRSTICANPWLLLVQQKIDRAFPKTGDKVILLINFPSDIRSYSNLSYVY